LIGTDKFTYDQWWTLRDVVVLLQTRNPDACEIGYCDLSNVIKTCLGCSPVGCANRREAHPTGLVSLSPSLDFLLRVLCRQQTKPETDGKLMTICAVAEIVVEHQRLNIAEKYCVLYSLFRFKAVLQMGGNAQTVAVVTISMAIEIIYPFQPKNLS